MADDARRLIDLIFENYAYPERLAGFPEQRLLSLKESDAPHIATGRELISVGERALAALFDHHAILGASLPNSYGLVPSYTDLWIEADARGRCVVEDVRMNSPAAAAGLRPGDALLGVEDVSVDRAISRFLESTAAHLTREQRSVCVRVLAAGRRDRPRRLEVSRRGVRRRLEIDNLYQARIERDGPLTVSPLSGNAAHLRINDSLGDDAATVAFDNAMHDLRDTHAVVVDLRDTPSGGNTRIARAVLGRFVDMPIPYQRHELPRDARNDGPRRSWIEEVSPRGERYRGRVIVLVGRWTGSMGEGLAIGFDAMGATVIGTRMAGLLGAVYDFRLPSSGLTLKLPTERLAHVNGMPRELFSPTNLLSFADAPNPDGADAALAHALNMLSN